MSHKYGVNYMKTIVALMLLLCAPQTVALAQSCAECGKRGVVGYAGGITGQPIPQSDPDSIRNYINLMLVPEYVAEYFRTSDPKIDCIYFVYTARGIDSSNFRVHAQYPRKPETYNTDYTDYYYKSTADGVDGDYVAPIYLYVGKTKELIRLHGSVLYHAGFDPVSIAQQEASGLAPLYGAIMEYEKKKRDGGVPYAIKPKVEIKAAKTILNFKEVTSVTVTITDCDGVPLKNRTMKVTVDEGGTLDKNTVTTDADGKDVLIFTAGSEPKIAVIQGEFTYTEPVEREKTADVEPCAISIKKPSDCWYAQGKITTENEYRSSTSALTKETSTSNDFQTVYFSAWVKEIALPTPNSFQSDATPVALKFYARSDGRNTGTSTFSNEAGTITRQVHGTVHADGKQSTVPKLNLNIQKTSYSFRLSEIDAIQTGREITLDDSWIKGEGHKSSSNTISPNPDVVMKGSVQGFNRDTAYTTRENFPDGGVTTVDFVKQTFFWKDKVLRLKYQNNYTETTNKQSQGVTIASQWTSETYADVTMYYNAGPSGIGDEQAPGPPAVFELGQNYPNPFNPSTVIRYTIPSLSRVRGRVSDALGRSISFWETNKERGTYTFDFNGAGLPSGVYFYSIEAEPYDKSPAVRDMKKMMLIK